MRLISKIIGNQEKPVSNSGGENVVLTTNPNLLDNPWFTVNQRGGASYATLNEYTVDRWKHPYGGTITVSSGGLSASGSIGSPTTIRQTFEQPSSDFIGKTLTISALIDGTIYSFTKEIESNAENGDVLVSSDGTWATMDTRSTNFNVNIAWCGSHTIRAVKLEIGSTSTLHLDTAPDYTTELLKCQRYFRRLTPVSNNEVIVSGFTWGTGNALCYAPIVPTMRATPTLTTSGTFSFKTYTTTVSSVSIQRDSGCSASLLGLYISKASSFTDNVVGSLIGTSSSYIDLDAEL